MSAAELDELPPENNKNDNQQSGSLLPALLAIVLAPVITVAAMYFLIKANKPDSAQLASVTQGGVPLNMESTGEERFYELGSLITNLGGPIKSLYINLELRLEGVAGDFEKLL